MICSTRAPRRESASVPSGLETTAVPTFTTTRRAFDRASRSAGTSSPRSLSQDRAEPAGNDPGARTGGVAVAIWRNSPRLAHLKWAPCNRLAHITGSQKPGKLHKRGTNLTHEPF